MDKLINSTTKEQIHRGDEVETFDGGRYILSDFYRGRSEASTGRVVLNTLDGYTEGEYYPSVIGAHIVTEAKLIMEKIAQKAKAPRSILEDTLEELKNDRKNIQAEIASLEMQIIKERYHGFFTDLEKRVELLQVPREDFAKFLRVARFEIISGLFTKQEGK